jgi:hypothetical protein
MEAAPNRQAAQTSVLGQKMTVCASVFGGPDDPSTWGNDVPGVPGHRDQTGYRGDRMLGQNAFAELGMGRGLGDLERKEKVVVTNPENGISLICQKLDVGRGGCDCGGFPRAIDLYYDTAAALGFIGLGVVEVQTLRP